MRFAITDPRTKAAVTAGLLFSLGAIAGVAADRWWFGGAPDLAAEPLTAVAMADALNLDATQRAQVAALLDSLELTVASAALEGPASLQAAARDARRRLVRAFPPARRDRFERWMSDRYAEMMERMCDDDVMRGGPAMMPEMMRGGRRADSGRSERMMPGREMMPERERIEREGKDERARGPSWMQDHDRIMRRCRNR